MLSMSLLGLGSQIKNLNKLYAKRYLTYRYLISTISTLQIRHEEEALMMLSKASSIQVVIWSSKNYLKKRFLASKKPVVWSNKTFLSCHIFFGIKLKKIFKQKLQILGRLRAICGILDLYINGTSLSSYRVVNWSPYFRTDTANFDQKPLPHIFYGWSTGSRKSERKWLNFWSRNCRNFEAKL